MLTIPPAPPIAPRQMTLLRVVAAMAWADGHLAEEEIAVMLDRLSHLFAADGTQRGDLESELREYVVQNIPLEEIAPQLQTTEEKEQALRVGYEVIASSALTPEEAAINDRESAAYQKLIDLLGLSPERVAEIEREAQASV